MSTTGNEASVGVLRASAPWIGLAAAVFTVVATVLVLTADEAPPSSDSGPALASRLDVGAPPPEPGPDPSGGATDALEAPPPQVPTGSEPGGDLTGEDLEDERKAQGEVPPGGLPKVPVVEVPPGRVELVEGSRDWLVHRVVGRETIDQIAYRYGVKPRSVRMWNGISEGAERAKRGARLRVKARKIPPARVALKYVVRPGDSWASIGVRFGVDSNELRALNWEQSATLTVGQIIEMWVDPVVFHWVATEDADPTKVRPGAVGIGPPQSGALVNGVQLPHNDYYQLRLPPSSYGTTFSIEAVLRGIVLFEARSDYGPPLIFGSMSWRHGGPLTGHVSHQSGRDLDIALPLLEKHPRGVPIRADRVDWDATWSLVTAMFDTKDVVVVFLDYELQKPLFEAATRLGATSEERAQYLQYPRGAQAPGLVRHSPGHDAHVHIRFACGPYEMECADNSLGQEIE